MVPFNLSAESLCTLIVLLSCLTCLHGYPTARRDRSVSHTASQSNHKCGTNGTRPSPFLWRIHRNPPAYLFGTIHVPYNQVWPQLPAEVDRAFRQTNHHYFELDAHDTSIAAEMMKCQYLPANQQLEDILPPSVMNRLRKYLLYVRFKFDSWMTMQQYMIGLHPDSFYRALTMHWMRRRPIWIVILLQSLTKSGVSSWGEPFLDMYLSGLSHQLGKQVGAIEKTDEQCQVLNSIDIQYQIYALNQTLDKHEKMRQEEDRLFEMKLKGLSTTMSSSGEPIAAERQETNDEEMNLEDMVAQYNCGNFSRLDLDQDSAWIGSLSKANTSNEFILKEESRIRSELLNKRDKRMASRVIKLLNSHPNRSYFFAFGVAHFLGNHSVLNHLESAGFKLQRYTAKRFD